MIALLPLEIVVVGGMLWSVPLSSPAFLCGLYGVYVMVGLYMTVRKNLLNPLTIATSERVSVRFLSGDATLASGGGDFWFGNAWIGIPEAARGKLGATYLYEHEYAHLVFHSQLLRCISITVSGVLLRNTAILFVAKLKSPTWLKNLVIVPLQVILVVPNLLHFYFYHLMEYACDTRALYSAGINETFTALTAMQQEWSECGEVPIYAVLTLLHFKSSGGTVTLGGGCSPLLYTHPRPTTRVEFIKWQRRYLPQFLQR